VIFAKRLNRSRTWVMDSGGSKEACIRWGPDPPSEGAIIKGKDMPGHARRQSAMSCAKMAEPIDFPFKLWTWVGRGSTTSVVFARFRQCHLMGGHLSATWRFALRYRTVVLSVCPSCLSVCDVGVLWPNGWMDQDEAWHRGRPRPRSYWVRWGPIPQKRGHSSPNFLSCLLWPNGWVDQDTAW